MRIVMVYKKESDATREVAEWLEAFRQRSELEVEELDPETLEGEGFCTARDIVRYPAVVVCDSEGKTYFTHQGRPLPMIDDVLGYVVN